MGTVVFDTDDLGEVARIISDTFTDTRIASLTGRGSACTRMSRSSLASLDVHDLSFGADIRYETQPADSVALARVETGP